MNQPDKTVSGPITPTMTLLEVIYQWRAAEAVFKAYEAKSGTCLCCHALFDTLEEAARKYHLDLTKLLADLNTLVQILESAEENRL